MKTLSVEVKSKNDLLGEVEVQEFVQLNEAVDFFQAEAGADASPAAGLAKVLGLINAQHRANVTNTFRAEKTRGVSPMAALRAAVKTNPHLKTALEALLTQFELPSNLDK